jgi:dTDP-4-amino-4,6-dideoxygalactose transaminase
VSKKRIVRLSNPALGIGELLSVAKVFQSGWVAGQGPQTLLFEKNLAKKLGSKYALAVSNATAGIYVALKALGVVAGDEIIVADYTYPATGHAVLFAGAVPVFVDVILETGNIDPNAIAALITNKTKGIIAVDVAGKCADYESLSRIAKENGIFLLQDAACSIGATRNGLFAGSLADVTVFSFHGRKGITCGEGGAIVTDSDTVFRSASSLISFGVTPAFQREKDDKINIPLFAEFGFNFKLSDISSGILNHQLTRLNKFISVRERNVKYYTELLKNLQEVSLPHYDEDSRHTWQTFAIRVETKEIRNELVGFLRSRGIQSNIGTFASHIQPVYKSKNRCPNSLLLFDTQIALPMHTKLSRSDIRLVSRTIKEFFAEIK